MDDHDSAVAGPADETDLAAENAWLREELARHKQSLALVSFAVGLFQMAMEMAGAPQVGLAPQ